MGKCYSCQELERCRMKFIAVTHNLDTDEKNPASRLLLHALGAATEFERSLFRERTAVVPEAGWDAAGTWGFGFGGFDFGRSYH